MSGWFMFVATQGLLTSVALGALKKEGVIRFAPLIPSSCIWNRHFYPDFYLKNQYSQQYMSPKRQMVIAASIRPRSRTLLCGQSLKARYVICLALDTLRLSCPHLPIGFSLKLNVSQVELGENVAHRAQKLYVSLTEVRPCRK
jgi:hypothetical protein